MKNKLFLVLLILFTVSCSKYECKEEQKVLVSNFVLICIPDHTIGTCISAGRELYCKEIKND